MCLESTCDVFSSSTGVFWNSVLDFNLEGKQGRHRKCFQCNLSSSNFSGASCQRVTLSNPIYFSWTNDFRFSRICPTLRSMPSSKTGNLKSIEFIASWQSYVGTLSNYTCHLWEIWEWGPSWTAVKSAIPFGHAHHSYKSQQMFHHQVWPCISSSVWQVRTLSMWWSAIVLLSHDEGCILFWLVAVCITLMSPFWVFWCFHSSSHVFPLLSHIFVLNLSFVQVLLCPPCRAFGCLRSAGDVQRWLQDRHDVPFDGMEV